MPKKYLSPFALPIVAMGAVIIAGALGLQATTTLPDGLTWVDALFTSTSAVCVTGLIVVDTPTAFTREGHWVLMALIQIGGLGIMTYSSLMLYLLRKRVSLTDRLSVGQALLHNSSFDLGRFLTRIVSATVAIELGGAALLYFGSGGTLNIFEALFHAVSAFCNAGFALFSDSLTAWRASLPVSGTIMLLITLGGVGFAVLDELMRFVHSRGRWRFSRAAKVIMSATVLLSVGGALLLYLSETLGGNNYGASEESVLAAIFQSVTCRTAGFNTVEIGSMTNVSLLIMLFLMYVGGAPGSCAGGIKVTTARTLWAFMMQQFKGGKQAVLGGSALGLSTLSRAFALFFSSVGLIVLATLLLSITEGGDMPHPMVRGQMLELLFEAVSAFATVGLSTGTTTTLSTAGKCIIMALMFIGRIGPIWMLSALQQMHREPRFRRPDIELPIG